MPDPSHRATIIEPAWIRRYTATSLGFPAWCDAFPGQLALISNRSGSNQAWAHDLASGSWRQVSDEPVGVEAVHVAPDGRIVWWRDDTGDERGLAVAVAFVGGEPEPLVPDIPNGWPMGLSFRGERTAIGLEVGGEYRVYVADAGAPARLVYASRSGAGVGDAWRGGEGGLSADGSLVCISLAEHGDILHFALRVLDVTTGAVVADLVDEGNNVTPAAWSPVPGDQRLAFTSELGHFERPALWHMGTGERTDIDVHLPGGVFPVAWYPGADALLLRHEHEGSAQLYRLTLAGGSVELVADPGGDIEEAAVRPDGDAWLQASSSVTPPTTRSAAGTVAVLNPDEPAPEGRAFAPHFFTNPLGERIQAFIVTPEGDGPFPFVMSVHGGPEWHERDRYDAETQAFVDAGFAVALINYRGSTGYGIAFRRALIGNVCFTETDDIIACLDSVVGAGIADPDRVFWSGWSWGGCLACFNAGVNPDRWRAIFAGIPAGDFVAAHWASAPELQAWDDAVYGGSPDEVPDAYRRSDPMTYAAAVTAPVLIIAGEHDPRCPVEGITPWVEAVRAVGTPVDVHWYATGHHANRMDEQVSHMKRILDFFDRHR